MSTPEQMWQPGITVHCRVRNEERFVRAAILSVLPLAKQVLVYDTGSTDATLERISSIKSEKIEVVHKPPVSPRELTAYRNEMIERTHTEWYMIVDGDEIYPANAVRRIDEEIERVPPSVHRLVVNRRHFAGSLNFVSVLDGAGRIFRTRKIRYGVASLTDRGGFGSETPYLADEPSTPWHQFSMRLPKDIFFFHCQYLSRSSKDAELGRLRGWRRPPFPVLPYCGPWPQALEVDGAAHQLNPGLLIQWMTVNARLFWTRCTHPSFKVPGLWRLKAWPPKDLVTFAALSGREAGR